MSAPGKPFWGLISLYAGLAALGLVLVDFKLGIFAPPPPPPPPAMAEKVSKTIEEKIEALVKKYWKKEKAAEESEEKKPDGPEREGWGRALHRTMAGLAILGILSGVTAWAKREDEKPIIAGMSCSLFSITWGHMVHIIFAAAAMAAILLFMILLKRANI